MDKVCFKCKEIKPISDYYKHKTMGDGHLNKCKACTKKDSTNYRNKNLFKIRDYDRHRGSRQSNYYLKEYRRKYPNKYKAHSLVNNSIRCGRLFREACEECGIETAIHAHHDDYAKPLNVRWLCSAHHSQWHMDNGEALNP